MAVMSFVNPLLLAGVALIAVPIVLHLVMRRKPRRIEFPALRLVQQRHETNRRRLRWRHLLLLALRVAVIALLALALARPSLKLSGMLGSRESPVAAALVFDTAARMQYRRANHTRLDAARELGRWLLRQLPPESQIGVLDTRPGPAAFQVDRGAAADRIDRLATVADSQTPAQSVAEAVRLLGTSDLPNKEIYVFTDLAQSAWPAEAAVRLRRVAEELPGASIHLIDVGVAEPENVALGPLRLSAEVVPRRGPVELETELSCTGSPGRRVVELCVLDANRTPRRRDQQTIALEADGSAPVTFRLGGLPLGTHQGFVRIVGQDALAADDLRFFTIDVAQAWPVLLVDPRSNHAHADYLALMLAPESMRRSGQARFACEVVGPDALAGSDLRRYAAVCLLDPGPLDPEIWELLERYVAAGGGLGVFLGRNATAEAMNQPEAQKLLPAPLEAPVAAAAPAGRLAPRDLAHPALAVFRQMDDAIPWAEAPVYRYWGLGPLASGAGVVVPFSDGQPALVERSVGDGRVMLWTTPVSDLADHDPWNLLPVADPWPFLVLTNQMMLHLVGGGATRLNYLAGQTAVVPLDRGATFRSYLLTTPTDAAFPLSVEPGEHRLVITATDEPGNYRIQAGGRASGVDRGLSVNLAVGQTDLARIDHDELADRFGPTPFRIARNRDEIEREVSIARVGRELFGPLILLVAALLLAEGVVANRFYRE